MLIWHTCLAATSPAKPLMYKKKITPNDIAKEILLILCPKPPIQKGTYEQQFSSPTLMNSNNTSLFYIYFYTIMNGVPNK